MGPGDGQAQVSTGIMHCKLSLWVYLELTSIDFCESCSRRPFTREVVEALQQQIVSLEAKLAATASGSIESADADPVPAATQEQAASETTEGQPSAETIEGGLSTNRHGEIRYFGPLSSMSVLADAAASAEGLQAARYAALTQACEPFNAIDYQPPPKPPPLSQELQGRLLRYAFEYALPAFCLVDERRFYADMAADKMSRTHNYSPLLLNVILGMGARYLEPNDDFPRAICTDPNDTDTRGEVFIDFARSVIDHEWKLPRISTLRALACLSLWMVGKRGYDGVSWLHIGMATRVAENCEFQCREGSLSILILGVLAQSAFTLVFITSRHRVT